MLADVAFEEEGAFDGKGRMTYQVADNNLAVSLGSWASWSGLDGTLNSASRLGNTTNWSSWSGWLASTTTAAVAVSTLAGGTSVGHDLVKRLVDLGRHFDMCRSDYLRWL